MQVPYLTCRHMTSSCLSTFIVSVRLMSPFKQWSPSQSRPGCRLRRACVSPESVPEAARAAAGSAGCDDLDMDTDGSET